MRRILAVAGILFSSTFARAASPPPAQLTVALALEQGVSLPGIPVSFLVTFTNAGSAPVSVPTKAALLVLRPDHTFSISHLQRYRNLLAR
jgi:hypothetical protein